MPLNVFTIAGEIKADMSAFDKSLRDAENKLRDTSKAIETTDRNATELGQTSATTARSFDRFRESLAQSQTKLNQAADAFRKGAINSREMASALNQTGSAAARMDSPGEHSIKVVRSGYKNWERKVQIEAGSIPSFNAILEKAI